MIGIEPEILVTSVLEYLLNCLMAAIKARRPRQYDSSGAF